MISVRCVDAKWPAWECNVRLAECERWLNTNCGERWIKWDWDQREYGLVLFLEPEAEIATMFRLKFGI